MIYINTVLSVMHDISSISLVMATSIAVKLPNLFMSLYDIRMTVIATIVISTHQIVEYNFSITYDLYRLQHYL